MARIKRRSLVERGERKTFVRDNGLAHTTGKKKKKRNFQKISDLHESNDKHKQLPANLLDYFLRSNESNIHQKRGWE